MIQSSETNIRGECIMADLVFDTTEGQTIDRELFIAYLNTGTASAPCVERHR